MEVRPVERHICIKKTMQHRNNTDWLAREIFWFIQSNVSCSEYYIAMQVQLVLIPLLCQSVIVSVLNSLRKNDFACMVEFSKCIRSSSIGSE